MDRIASFFVENLPSWKEILLWGPPGLAWAYLGLHFAGYLKVKKGLKTGYTRKIYHFVIFTSVAGIHAVGGTRQVCLFGGMASIVVLYAILRGAGNPLYEAMAREKDEPHRTYFIVAPYFATLIGGFTSNIFIPGGAVVGYLVTGFGDAIAEPVGTRFGRHPYRVPSLTGVRTTRSLEGSAGVCIASVIAIATAILLTPEMAFSARSLWAIPLLAFASAMVEAISPHGWDNATMLIIPSYLATLLL